MSTGYCTLRSNTKKKLHLCVGCWRGWRWVMASAPPSWRSSWRLYGGRVMAF